MKDLNFVELVTAKVIHCFDAYGICLKHCSGWKIVYSGDTRPCIELIEKGQDATILIHEATLENELQEEAATKRHSTTDDALSVAERCFSLHVVLNILECTLHT